METEAVHGKHLNQSSKQITASEGYLTIFILALEEARAKFIHFPSRRAEAPVKGVYAVILILDFC